MYKLSSKMKKCYISIPEIIRLKYHSDSEKDLLSYNEV